MHIDNVHIIACNIMNIFSVSPFCSSIRRRVICGPADRSTGIRRTRRADQVCRISVIHSTVVIATYYFMDIDQCNSEHLARYNLQPWWLLSICTPFPRHLLWVFSHCSTCLPYPRTQAGWNARRIFPPRCQHCSRLADNKQHHHCHRRWDGHQTSYWQAPASR